MHAFLTPEKNPAKAAELRELLDGGLTWDS
jgi:hypothetical protein